MTIEFPQITVIMPIRNESEYIERSLSAVLTQDYSKDKMEVLVVDGMSTDDTRAIIQRISANNDIPITILDNPDLIVPTAMNAAIRKASGDVIVRVDGHAVIKSDYIRRCIDHLMENGVDCVGGVIDPVGIGYAGKAIAIAMNSKFGVGGSAFRTLSDKKPILAESVPFGAYRKDVFNRVGLFNEQMVRHQDYESCYRLRKNGGKILLLPTARSDYYVRTTLRALLRQYWQYGIWKGRFVRKYPDSLTLRHLVAPALILLIVLSGVLAIFSTVGALFLAMGLGAYSIFILTSIVYFFTKGKLKYLPILALILPSIHYSWGIGFWKGLFMKKLD
jgi:cellulose synthase/poly-beta-1,6-N-acetylglucosamine synthase-like glycosyltransferase